MGDRRDRCRWAGGGALAATPARLGRRLTDRSSGAAARALLLAATAAIPFHELTWRVGGIGLRPFESLLLLAAAAAVPSAWRCRREWSRARGVDREVVGVVALGALSLLVTSGPGDSLRALRLVILEPALYYLLLSRSIVGSRDVLAVATALVGGGVAASLVGFGQLLTGVGPIEAEGVDRIRAAYRSPNNLALLLDRTVPLAAALAVGLAARGVGTPALPSRSGEASLGSPAAPSPGRAAFPGGLDRPTWLGRPLAALAFGINGLAATLTYSLGGWLATVLGVVVAIGLARGRRAVAWLALIGCLVAGLGLAVGSERIGRHFDVGVETTSGTRVLLWRSGVEMVRDHPLFGVGLDNFVHHYNPARGGDYMEPAAWREPDLSHPHNLLLDWWLSLGVLGVLLLARALARTIQLAWEAWHLAVSDSLARTLVAGLIGAVTAGLAHGLIDNSFFLPDLAAIWWLSLAGLTSLAHRSQPQHPAQDAAPPSPPR